MNIFKGCRLLCSSCMARQGWSALLLSTLIALVAVVVSGCAEGGGLTSTDISLPGGGDSSTPTSQVAVQSGWNSLESQNWAQAESHFQSVINDAGASAADKAQAYSGLGWVIVRSQGGFYDDSGVFQDETVQYFSTASTLLDEGRVGLALAYIHRNASSADSANAALLLEQVVADDTFEPAYDIGLNLADVWLLLAISRMESGQTDEAAAALARAKELGATTADSDVFNNIADAIEVLL